MSVTLVTGLWDIKRESLAEGWSRSYDHYISKFRQLLDVPYNLIIFGESSLRDIVFEKRNETNTQFIERSSDWFKNEFYDKIQKIRTNKDWLNQAGWLRESTQAKLEMYNPLVMSKVFLLHDAKVLDKFNSSHLFWIDGGITNTVHPGYFTHDKVLDKLTSIDKISFIAFPYSANNEIHGFSYSKICELSGDKVNKVCRGGFFGGPKEDIAEFNSEYYHIMSDTLSQGYMGTEESLFTIMVYSTPKKYQYFLIENNGLIGKFFEDVKNNKHQPLSERKYENEILSLNMDNVGLYVIAFNSPKQFKRLIESMLEYDKDFIEKPQKFLLDNSTDLTTTPEYEKLCEEFGFEHIKKDNLGIVGGRVFIAEHFEESNLDAYFFFEDDMFFYGKKNEVCKNGFNRYVPNLYRKSLEILKNENFDFLKLNFTEFFGDNSTQWAWYNTPNEFREKHWPNNKKLPKKGLDPNAPKTEFKHIKSYKGIPYASGEIYLCNWPIVLSKKGNYKCYLETKWAHPFEQTLMSYAYQETVKGNINPGILLLTPTDHNRFDHYDGKLRKES